ncbi:glyoxalase/bleomycin resistance/dioxygenase family protein [Streptomyces sp. NPDC057854]|uniref:glyoxalase/bleomycin resistance/dioxygenase family protein n=1 Tax=unclassified Streptomyces TaxID=2593676 RepID=UPI0036B5B4F7
MINDLIVLYTERLDACRDFYSGLGLTLVRERHGTGPEHYAATLAHGAVLELYPANRRPATGYLRLGLTAPARAADTPAGRQTLTDPDGRTVVLTTLEENTMPTEQTARAAIARILGADAHTTAIAFPAGNLSLVITIGDHTITIDGHDTSGWGWTIGPGTDDGFTGHENVADTLETALTQAREQLGT